MPLAAFSFLLLVRHFRQTLVVTPLPLSFCYHPGLT